MPVKTLAERFRALRIDKSEPAPVYAQIAAGLAKAIRSGTIPPGAALPPERVLCEQFGVSRMTLRQAYDALQHDGLIESQRGRGTFVALRRIEKQQQEMRSFTEEITARGAVPSSRLLGFRTVRAGADELEFFALPAGELVWEIERVRFADGIPLAHETVHVPQSLCPKLDRFHLAQQSLYLILEENYGLILDHCTEEISAALPTRKQRDLLEMPAKEAVLAVKRRTYSDRETAVEFARTAYRGDLYSAMVHSARKLR